MRGIPLLAKKMLASEERLFPIQFVSWLLGLLVGWLVFCYLASQ